MRIFGYISEQDSRHSGSTTPFLSDYNFHECHRSALIHARADAILDAVARLVLHFQLLAEGDAWRLQTETFINCPDKATRLKLLPYWLLIRTASGIIRRRTLAAIQRQLSPT